jgi:hypothetical protein
MAIGGRGAGRAARRSVDRARVELVAAREHGERRDWRCAAAGRSYGDAASNVGGRVLDLSALNRILRFRSPRRASRASSREFASAICGGTRSRTATGRSVVPGTMAGLARWCGGDERARQECLRGGDDFGDHVRGFTLAGAAMANRWSSAVASSNPDDVPRGDLAASGCSVCFTELTVELKKVHSGRLRVWGIAMRSLEDGIAIIEDLREQARTTWSAGATSARQEASVSAAV